ncbi:GNAT family protein [Fictibacillus enclensis]|uniref:GNAT family N-acetyltransferase n=1 Tax=Fictibacillus enclensis TaxID=1017270 RepID=UPI0024C059FA|nr:GNAT family protein [Fictibacillus enclensis]MDM5336277.1 GNAT family protein [Fictibacillus enclensis]WHY72773.1 GNAT family protein [Fictibacillus enclensis]
MFFLQVDEEISLKLLEKRDAQLLFQLTEHSRDHLRNWLGWVDYSRTLKDTKTFIKLANQKYADSTDLVTMIWYRGIPAGSLALYDIKWNNYSANIGYWLGKDFEGKGIMVRSCGAMVDYSFGTLSLNRLELKAALANKRSRSVAERLGFKQEGELRQAEWLYDHFVDVALYGMLAEDWAFSKT